MAVMVPNTNTFDLTDVYAAVSDHATPAAKLSDCFAKGDVNFFDATYSGSKDRLSNFRNYGPKGKVYEIEFMRILDAPYSYGNEVNWQYLQPGVYYYLEARLNNPDTTFVKNLYWKMYWGELSTPSRHDYTWIYFDVPLAKNKYVVWDHDFSGNQIKNLVTDKPATFDLPGVKYDQAVANNYGDIFYVKFQIKPYANFTEKKNIHLYNEAVSGGDLISFINPNKSFLVSYVQSSNFRMWFPNPVQKGHDITLYGYSGVAYQAKLVTMMGQVLSMSYISGNSATYVTVPSSTTSGTYYLRLYDTNGNEVLDLGAVSVL